MTQQSMQQAITHPWDLDEAAALALQTELASRVISQDQFGAIRRIAGVDVAYDQHSDRLIAAAVVIDADTLAVLEHATASDMVRFPYIPGLFSFREAPAILQALSALGQAPDLIVCDGQGLAHPRRFGLACHLGVLLDIPTLGCGKTRLLGRADEPADQRGASSPLYDGVEIVGRVLRTQTGIKPVYVSTGHRVSVESACRLVLKISPHYRLPETTRLANNIVQNLVHGRAPDLLKGV